MFLWVMFLSYALENILIKQGLFVPRPYIAPEELAGAAFAEIVRTMVYLVLIVWTGFSKRFKAWVSPPEGSGDDWQDAASNPKPEGTSEVEK